MHRRIKWIAGTALLALAVVAATPWALSGVGTRQEIARQVKLATGFEVDEIGRVSLAVLPRPAIRIETFAVHASDGAFKVRSAGLHGDLRILPLIAGRFELANAMLLGPAVEMDVERALSSAREGRPDPTGAPATAPGLRTVALQGGKAMLRGAGRQIELDNLEIMVDWRGITAPLSLRGAFDWRGDRVQTAIWVGKPASLGGEEGSPTVARFESSNATASFDGTAAGGSSFFLDGRVAISTTSAAGLFRGLAAATPSLTRSGAMSFDGIARLSRHELSVGNARFSIAGSNFDGVLSAISSETGARVSGTLATDLLDLTPFIQAFASIARSSDAGFAHRFAANGTGETDLDLRLSAAHARLGPYDAERAGISILKSGDQIEISLAEASAYKGSLKGRIAINRDTDGLDWRAQASVAHIDIGALGAAARQPQRLAGSGSGEFALRANGVDLAAILASLGGTAKIEVTNGEIAGLDLEQALRRAERRPLSLATELRGGKTQFNRLAGSLLIDKGVALIENAEGAGAGVAFVMTGAATIPTHELALRLKAWQASPTAPVPGAMQLAIDVGGAWDAPLLVVDPQSLIQRSRAAAPLRDPEPIAEPAAEAR
jgi:AsmA protein